VRRGTGQPPPGAPAGPQNVQIVEGTEKKPQALAKLCLKAMGETRFDVSKMPNNTYPEIEWDYDLPAEALARLCDSLNCRVVLRLDDTVSIEPIGKGAELPKGQETEGGEEVDVPERPDELVLLGQQKFQLDLALEAVGRERWGEVKPIDKLSYAPAEGWGRPDWKFMQCVSNNYDREIAKETVFRWYRIKKNFWVPQLGWFIRTLDEVLPIDDRQIDSHWTDGRWEPLPAWIYGRFYGGDESPRAWIDNGKINVFNILAAIVSQIVKFPKGLYTKPFSIDKERGIVMFSDPVFQLNTNYSHGTDNGKGGWCMPAELRLRVSFSVRDADDWGWVRPEYRRKLGGAKSGAKPRYIVRDDVEFHSVEYPDGGKWDNEQPCKKIAETYLDAYEAEYTPKKPSSVGYAGFKKIDVDGAIQQVTWTRSEAGYATTRATRHREDIAFFPSHKERQLAQQLGTVVPKAQMIDWRRWIALLKSRA
jgi:hypothetical protein